MISRIFDKVNNKRIEGTITEFHYQDDIFDKGWHYVTITLDDGSEKKACLARDEYKPLDIGQRISGLQFDGFNIPHGEADITLCEVEEIEQNSSLLKRTMLRPLRKIFEDLAAVETAANNPYFGRLAHMAGSKAYGENGRWIRPPDPETEREKYAHTFAQPTHELDEDGLTPEESAQWNAQEQARQGKDAAYIRDVVQGNINIDDQIPEDMPPEKAAEFREYLERWHANIRRDHQTEQGDYETELAL